MFNNILIILESIINRVFKSILIINIINRVIRLNIIIDKEKMYICLIKLD
jgi:hypothetical protein